MANWFTRNKTEPAPKITQDPELEAILSKKEALRERIEQREQTIEDLRDEILDSMRESLVEMYDGLCKDNKEDIYFLLAHLKGYGSCDQITPFLNENSDILDSQEKEYVEALLAREKFTEKELFSNFFFYSGFIGQAITENKPELWISATIAFKLLVNSQLDPEEKEYFSLFADSVNNGLSAEEKEIYEKIQARRNPVASAGVPDSSATPVVDSSAEKDNTNKLENLNPFYMSQNKGDTFYPNSKSSEYKEGHCAYKFTPNSADEAEFEFISDSATLKMINNNDVGSIKSACRVEGDNTDKNIKKIETLERGIAKKNDKGEWIVTKKAKVQYIKESDNTKTLENTPKFYFGGHADVDGGYFEDSQKEEKYKLGYCMFECTPTGDGEAEFSAVNDVETLKFVLDDYVEKYKGSCILTNYPSKTTKEIFTVTPGKVVKRGDRWEVVKKAEIKFK